MGEKSIETFQELFMEGLTFKEEKKGNFLIYENKEQPDLGYVIQYTRPGYFTVGMGDYTVPEDFKVGFGHSETLLRFGMVYSGETNFKITGNEVSSFTPSSFLVVESCPEGIQAWKRGQHFHGTEITIYQTWLEQVLRPVYEGGCINLEQIPHNITQKYLPADLVKVIHQIENILSRRSFSEILLDSKVMECLAIISEEYDHVEEEVFTSYYNRERIRIGKDRYITLSIQDIELIKKAHELLSEQACCQITIRQLSEQLHLSEQKLKAGFSHLYHMTIWEYANSIRMSEAANLLATTDIKIKEIAERAGYSSPGTFGNMFRKQFQKTPNQFRREHAYKNEVKNL